MSEPEDLRQWHRWFGLALTDQLTGQDCQVILEMDLSLKQQYLDVVVLRFHPERPLTVELPDGLDDLQPHNLISFKSFHEAFDLDALLELHSHAVNYRKQNGTAGNWLPRQQVALYAVSVRFPQNLAAQVQLQRRSEGVYDVQGPGPVRVRLIVGHELPQQPRNAMLHVLSYRQDLALYGCRHYQRRSADISSFLRQLLQRYQEGGMAMPYKVEDFIKEFRQKELPGLIDEMADEEIEMLLEKSRLLQRIPIDKRLEGVPIDKRLQDVPVEKRLEGVPIDKRLQDVPVEKRLEGVPIDKRLQDVPVEKRLEGVPIDKRLQDVPVEKVLEQVPIEKILQALSPQMREALRRHLQGESSAPPSAEPPSNG